MTFYDMDEAAVKDGVVKKFQGQTAAGAVELKPFEIVLKGYITPEYQQRTGWAGYDRTKAGMAEFVQSFGIPHVEGEIRAGEHGTYDAVIKAGGPAQAAELYAMFAALGKAAPRHLPPGRQQRGPSDWVGIEPSQDPDLPPR